MSTKRDYYEILGVGKTAAKDEIKRAYRKKALEYHPDRNKAADAEEKFKEVTEAYEVLLDDQKRQMYDQFGHAAFDPRSGGYGGVKNAGRAGPFTYTYYSNGGGGGSPFGDFGGVDFGDPFQIFEQFFGGTSPFGRAQRAKPHYSLSISFIEAVKGAERTIVHQGTQHTVKIPPGASDGTRIRFNEFDVSINVAPDERFKRDGDDLFTDVEIPFTAAALGGDLAVPTVDEPVKLRVRPGTQPNTMIRLRERGVPHLRGGGRGDLYIRLVITIPKTLSREQKQLLQEFERVQL